MKKSLIIILFVFLLTACTNATNKEIPSENEIDQEEKEMEEGKREEEELEKEDEVDEGSDPNQSISLSKDEANEKEKTNKENEEANTDSPQSSDQKTDSSSSANTGNVEQHAHQEVIQLAYDIFDAQDQKDYAFLTSVVSKGTTVDEKKEIFIFENVTYPYELEFFTKEDLGNLEFRYAHESDEGSVFVGFGAIHSGDASSFVVDFEFIRENGQWKMNRMDINK